MDKMTMLVEEALKEILIDTLEIKPDEFKPEAKLADDFGVDSTEMVEIILSLEK
ncbi:MAG: acyl carrier protein, partial [Proteobacteria bacterium]|nr:acyl carrier protein [Pseudomonadota bacterium]